VDSVAPQLRLRWQRPRVEKSDNSDYVGCGYRCPISGAGNILRTKKERGRLIVHALMFA